ncbi:MAG: alpha/beta fold hydrolase [Anaerolineae bacterium]
MSPKLPSSHARSRRSSGRFLTHSLYRFALCLLIISLACGGVWPGAPRSAQAQEADPPAGQGAPPEEALPEVTPDAAVPVPGMQTPNGLAVDPVTHGVYITSRNNDRLLMLDGFTNRVLGQAAVGDSPWGVAVDSANKRVYVADFASGDLRILAADTLAPIAMVPLVSNNVTAQPTNVATSNNLGLALVADHRANKLYVVNGVTGAVVTAQPTNASGAWGVAYNPVLNRAYVSHRDDGKVTTMDGTAGWVQLPGQTLQPCGAGGQAYGLGFNAFQQILYIACAAPLGNVNVVKVYATETSGFRFLASVPVGSGGDDGGGGIAINTQTGNVFFTNSTSNTVSVINSTTHQVIATLSAGTRPFGAAVDPVTGKVFIGNKGSNDLTILNDTYPANPALPAITLSKKMTCQGQQITVTGRNFPASGSLGHATVYFNGVYKVTAGTQTNGTFTATIAVPPNPGGMQTVTGSELLWPWLQVGALTRTPLPNLPIIFLPGLAGSELRTGSAFNLLTPPNPALCLSLTPSSPCWLPEDHIYLNNEVVWLGLRGIATAFLGQWRYLDALALESDGRTPRADMIGIRPSIVVGEPLWNIAGLQPVYQPLDAFLEGMGYVDGQTLFYFPYDWRKDYISMDQALDDLVNLALQRSGKDKVILMAHSTGGVVARNYLLRRGTAKVDQLISMGTPYIGSPVAARAMEVGDDMGIGGHFFGDLGIGLHPKQGKALAQNFAGLYDLLPSSLWFTPSPADQGAAPPPYLVRSYLQGTTVIQEPLDFTQSTAWLNSRRNATLLNNALVFQNQGIGDMSRLTDQYFGQRIASTGRETPARIEYSPRQVCSIVFGLNVCVPLPEFAFAKNEPFGDNTIALRSAIGGNIPAGDDRYYVLQGIEHMKLPADPNVHLLLLEMLDGLRCGGGGIPDNLESIQTFSGTEITLMGTADLHIFDAAGNHTGPLLDQPAGIEDNLPGVDYSLGQDSVVVSVMSGGPYTVRVGGQQLDGAAMLRVSQVVQDVPTSTTIFAGMPISGTTTASFTLAGPGQPPSALTFQYTPSTPPQTDPSVVLTGAAAQDINPPVTTLTREIQSNLVTVTANDGPAGSGVARILVSTQSPPLTYDVYSGPFPVPASVHCVSALAVDQAGNAGLTQTVCRTWLPLVRR